MKRIHLCNLSELPLRGGRLFSDVDGELTHVIVFRLGGEEIAAYDASCPHAGALLKPENEMGGRLICTMHRWAFDVASGECLTHPGCPLESYEVAVDAEEIFVLIPE